MKVCPKCFETNEEAAEFCQDCGAPLVDGGEGSDQEVYKDLARANLLRMRGDMKAANDVCLGILRRYPNNPTAHGLLGDISADQGDLAQAATWYEMALELVPDSVADRQKLDSVKERIKLKESMATAQQIGIPTQAPRTTPYIIAVCVMMLVVGTGAYLIGRGVVAANTKSTIDTPVILTPSNENDKSHEKAPVDEQKEVQTDPSTTQFSGTSTGVQSDAAILGALHGRGEAKIEYLGAAEDPRGQFAIVTIKSNPQEVPGLTATKAALEFYSLFPAFKKVTIRVMGDSGFVLVADMTQEAAKTAKEAIDNGDSYENQSQVALSQTWTPPHPVENTGGDQGK